MRAVGLRSFGGPEVLEVLDVPDPQPLDGEVRIRVHAATVNPTDIGFRSGRSEEALRTHPSPYVPGMELAGVVDSLGGGAPFAVGDRVMAIVAPTRTGRGAQSEFVALPSESVAAIPHGVTFEAAATLPMNGLTVRRALDLLALQRGQTLVVTGAAGAVGGYGIELAKVSGLRVIAIAGHDDEILVRSLGADVAVPRGPEAVAKVRQLTGGGADALLDAAAIGGPALGMVKDGGAVAAVRAFDGEPERGIEIQQVRVSDYLTNRSALEELADLVTEGRLTLRVAETYSPDQASIAHRRLSDGGVRGRLVILF